MHESNGVAVILVAAGAGRRFEAGGPPKQFRSLGGRRVVEFGLRAVRGLPDLQHIVLVVPEDWRDFAAREFASPDPGVGFTVVPGGDTRQASVGAGLVAVQDAPWVVVHDAARPFADTAMFRRVVDAARRTGAATAALPVRDTLVHEAPAVTPEAPAGEAPPCYGRHVERRGAWAVQTPQAFRTEILRRAHDAARRAGRTGTDDAGLVAALGVEVLLVTGTWYNLKITTAEDWAVAEKIAGLIVADRGDAARDA